MSQKGWQANMSMSDRLAAGMKLMSACKRASPNADRSLVHTEAKAIEENAFQIAVSQEHYHELLQSALKQLAATTSETEAPIPSVPAKIYSTSSVTTRPIGPYSASYHASGLFSTVYVASSTQSSSLIALKLTTPSQMFPPHNSVREARILALTAHSSIIPLLSTFQQPGGHLVLVFPFVPHDFAALLDQGALTPSQFRSHLRDLFSALVHIHSLGVIHRDIKPSNILLMSPSGPAYLADFGIAWMEGDPESEPSEAKITDVGTTCYRPPELLFGNTAYDSSLDMWAAGCTVAEALLGPRKTLFDAGPLGSELALIASIFKTLGTPTTTTWSEAKRFPDWGKIQFHHYPRKEWRDILPDVGDDARDMVSELVIYQSTDRLSASEALDHPFFSKV